VTKLNKLTVLTAADKLTEIRRLYFATTCQTIDADLARAVQLLTSMDTEDERERVRVYMDGLAQMRSDWARAAKPGKPGGPGGPGMGAGQAGRSRRQKPAKV
jgi:hypothetical protein